MCVRTLQEKTKELAQKQAQQWVSLSSRRRACALQLFFELFLNAPVCQCVYLTVFNPPLSARVCPCSQDPASLSLLSISDLIPDLQTIFFWMSNSIEILYFIQQRAPAYTHTMETLQGARRAETARSHYCLWHTSCADNATSFLLFTAYLLPVSLSLYPCV